MASARKNLSPCASTVASQVIRNGIAPTPRVTITQMRRCGLSDQSCHSNRAPEAQSEARPRQISNKMRALREEYREKRPYQQSFVVSGSSSSSARQQQQLSTQATSSTTLKVAAAGNIASAGQMCTKAVISEDTSILQPELQRAELNGVQRSTFPLPTPSSTEPSPTPSSLLANSQRTNSSHAPSSETNSLLAPSSQANSSLTPSSPTKYSIPQSGLGVLSGLGVNSGLGLDSGATTAEEMHRRPTWLEGSKSEL